MGINSFFFESAEYNLNLRMNNHPLSQCFPDFGVECLKSKPVCLCCPILNVELRAVIMSMNGKSI
jgi:hypothetical protein